jgi:uncharacterized protein (DUF433 family)
VITAHIGKAIYKGVYPAYTYPKRIHREKHAMTDRFIASDPGGRPVIAGTHVTVEEVLKELAAWGEVDRILTAHPELDREAVQAALEFAAEKVHGTASVPLESLSTEIEHFVPRTDFGRELLELRKKALEELRAHNEPLLDLEGIRREVRERRGVRDFGGDD